MYGNAAGGRILAKYNGGTYVGWDLFFDGSGYVNARIGNTVGLFYMLATDSGDTRGAGFHYLSATYDAEAPRMDLRVDGNLASDDVPEGDPSPDLTTIGATIGDIGAEGAFLTGDIAEIIYYSAALSDYHRGVLYAYLDRKFRPVPVPATLALLGLGCLALQLTRRRRTAS